MQQHLRSRAAGQALHRPLLALPTYGLPYVSDCQRNGARRMATSSQSFGKLTSEDVAIFTSIVGRANVITDSDDLAAYNVDWMKKYRGSSKLALRPGSTAEVSSILAHCHARRLPIVPQGGNTGLVGGGVAVHDEIVLSLSRMESIISVDTHAGHLVCEAGCVLEALQAHVADKGFTMPLDLGAKGSCQIGGNLATNAGGLRYLRYGSLHGTVLGLEAVLADGTVLDALTSLRKDNTGYDLKQLFIGSEGTLGVITKVAIALPKLPASTKLALLGVDSFDNVLKTFGAARAELGEVLSAIEFLDAESYELVTTRGGVRPPLQPSCRHYVLVELAGSCARHDEEKLSNFLESVVGSGVAVDGTIAQGEEQSAAIWRVRENITSSLASAGAVYKYDLSIRLDEMYDLVEEMRGRLKPLGVETVAFGHLGDGNVHLNFYTPDQFDHDEKLLDAIEQPVYQWISERRGSISAEHGIGIMKPNVLHLSNSDVALQLMHRIKALLDPKGILNPHKVLPEL